MGVLFLKRGMSALYVYSDVSFNSFPNGGSQGGYLVFICDKNKKSMPIAWCFNKLKRVYHSALAAENLTLSDGCNIAVFMKNLVKENMHNH